MYHHTDAGTKVAYSSRVSRSEPSTFENLLVQLELEEMEQVEENGSLEPMFLSSHQQLVPKIKAGMHDANDSTEDNVFNLGDLYAAI